jgi:hypothetical protein
MLMRKRLIEWGKNLAIVLLTISALYLLLRSQLYSNLSTLSLSSLVPGLDASVSDTTESSSLLQVVLPVSLAVYHDGGRYGVQYSADESDTLFKDMTPLLTDALSTLGEPMVISEDTFRTALTSTGLYLEFLSPLPLSVLTLSFTNGASELDSDTTTRQIVLAVDSGTQAVMLYYRSTADNLFYAASVSGVTADRLQSALSDYQPNSSFFAFEDTVYSILAPYTLIGATAPTVDEYTASNPIPTDLDSIKSELLPGLSFSAQTALSYPGSNDDTVFRQDSDTLRITTGGEIIYQAGNAYIRYSKCDTLWTALTSVHSILAKSVMLNGSGEAKLYLSGLERTEDSTVLTFDYSLDGAFVQLTDIPYAAQFTITDGVITDYFLYPRTFTATGQTISILPQRQAAAAMVAMSALNLTQHSLFLSYQGITFGTIAAGWVAGS